MACKTDKIDSMVLAVLSQRDLVPAIWLSDPRVREERELARFRLHLVKHKSALKNRIHSTLINFGKPCPVTDLFGVKDRKLLRAPRGPRAVARRISPPRVALIDDLEDQIAEANKRLEPATPTTLHPAAASAAGIGWVLAFTIAAEIGEIERFQAPRSSPATRACARG